MKSRKNRVIAVLAALVVILAGADVYFLLRYAGGADTLSSWWQGATQLEGVRELIGRVSSGGDAEGTALELLKQGAALEQQGQPREALSHYQQARELAPDQPLIYVGLASAQEAMGSPDQALAHLQRAAELDPEDAYVRRLLGRMYCMTGNIDACVRDLERSVELDPEDKWARYWLGNAYQQTSVDGYDKALAEYEQALGLDPEFGEVHLGLGFLYKNRPGKEALSIEEFRKAVEAEWETDDESMKVLARAELAQLYYGRDNYTQCIEEWKQVLESDADNADAHFFMGVCYAMRDRAGDLEIAIDEMETGLALGLPRLDIYYQFLAKQRERQEDVTGAVWAWQQFLRFSTDENLNAEVLGRIERLGE